MAAAAAPNAGRPAALGRDEMHGTEGASLIARAHALNHFIDMQGRAAAAAAAAATAAGTATGTPAAGGNSDSGRNNNSGSSSGSDGVGRGASTTARTPPPQRGARANMATQSDPDSPNPAGCLCFGAPSSARVAAHGRVHGGGNGGTGSRGAATSETGPIRPPRAYFPDNLAAQPQRHPWGPDMEWVIIGCVDFLEADGLGEPNLFAVSAVDDLVRNLVLPSGKALPPNTDPHVASGAIKARIRHATEPLVSKACLRRFIETQPVQTSPTPIPSANNHYGSGGANTQVIQKTIASGAIPAAAVASPTADVAFADTHLAHSLKITEEETSPRRAYIFARFMRLLGRVSANVAESRMNAHCLAKCVAPSMLHWDPNSTFSLLMLGKITAYVMTMIEEARVHDEALCEAIEKLA